MVALPSAYASVEWDTLHTSGAASGLIRDWDGDGWIRIDVVAGVTYDFSASTQGLQGNDATLTLVDPSGTVVAQTPPPGGFPDEISTIKWTATATEAIYARVVNETGADGPIDFFVSAADLTDRFLGSGEDTAQGAGGERIFGGLGNDTIYLGGASEAIGGAGDDYLNAAAESSGKRMSGGEGRDLIQGSGAADTIWGGNGLDLLYGNEGADLIFGGGDGDDLGGRAGADQIFGGDGSDRITDGADGDKMHGEAGNDVLVASGAVSGDVFDGGFGNDTLKPMNGAASIDLGLVTLTSIEAIRLTAVQSFDVIVNAAQIGGGALASNAAIIGVASTSTRDELTVNLGARHSVDLSGLRFANFSDPADLVSVVGTASADTVRGSAVNDSVAGAGGSDSLDGGAGADTMAGGAGNDTYVVDSLDDVVTEAGGGVDFVLSSHSFSLAGQSIENLTLAGTAAIGGAGNSLANRITGNSGANLLDGATGADTLTGGAGDDTYVVDDVKDVVVESGGGTDLVKASVDFSLAGKALENLTLTGSASHGSGNGYANVLVGNSAANVLDGGLGADTLTGGAGHDYFAFSTTLGSTNLDRITDYVVADDTIRLDHAVFKGLPTGALASSAFRVGTSAGDTTDRIIYDSATGKLFFDDDGTGGHAAKPFATLSAHLALTNADFQVT